MITGRKENFLFEVAPKKKRPVFSDQVFEITDKSVKDTSNKRHKPLEARKLVLRPQERLDLLLALTEADSLTTTYINEIFTEVYSVHSRELNQYNFMALAYLYMIHHINSNTDLTSKSKASIHRTIGTIFPQLFE